MVGNCEFRFSLFSALAIGFFGGILFGAYDVAIHLLAENTPLVLPVDLLSFSLYPVLFSAILAMAGMAFFAVLSFLSLKAGEVNLDQKKIVSLYLGLFVLLITSGINFNRFTQTPNKDYLALVFFTLFSIFSSISIFVLTHYLIKNFSRRFLAVLAGFIILSPVLLFSYIWQRQKIDPANFHFSPDKEDLNYGHKPPNILLIVMDATRARNMSVYGYKRKTTPQLEKIAQEGMVYKNAITTAPWTLPSHASMLTGLYPSRHGADGAWPWLANEFDTLAEILKKHGYYTVAFSNNYFFGKRTNLTQGFDTFILLSQDRNIKPKSSLAHPIKFFQRKFSLEDNFLLEKLYNLISREAFHADAGAFRTNLLIEKYLNHLPRRNRPFFIMINYMEVHGPYGISPSYSKYLDSIGIPAVKGLIIRDKAAHDIFAKAAKKEKITPEESQILTALYDGDLFYLDNYIGQLVDLFKEKNLLDNTLLIITSDHGENLGERNFISHLFDIHRTLTHIPLIIRFPKLFPAGKVEEKIVQNVDLFPTILQAAKVPFDKQSIQGYSLLNSDRPQIAFTEGQFKQAFLTIDETVGRFKDIDQRVFVGNWRSVQIGDFEYLEDAKDKYLYNLKEDPQEKNNLIDQYPQQAAEMKEKLIEWMLSFKPYFDIL